MFEVEGIMCRWVVKSTDLNQLAWVQIPTLKFAEPSAWQTVRTHIMLGIVSACRLLTRLNFCVLGKCLTIWLSCYIRPQERFSPGKMKTEWLQGPVPVQIKRSGPSCRVSGPGWMGALRHIFNRSSHLGPKVHSSHSRGFVFIFKISKKRT